MILSEDEARTKWCPFTRMVPSEGGAVYNRVGYAAERYATERITTPFACRCVGTDCMMWRRLGQNSNKIETGCCGLAHPNP